MSEKSKQVHLQVLERLKEISSASLSELARDLSLPKSSLHGILAELERTNYVWRAEESFGRYYLGPRSLQLGMAYVDSAMSRVERSMLHAVAHELRLPCQLAVLHNQDVIIVDRAVPDTSFFRTYATPGAVLPAHATSLGKAILSTMEDSELAQTISSWQLQRITDHTITEVGKLIDVIRAGRELKYYLDVQESTIGVHCVAVPIRRNGPQGRLAAAVSVSWITTANEEDQLLARNGLALHKLVEDHDLT